MEFPAVVVAAGKGQSSAPTWGLADDGGPDPAKKHGSPSPLPLSPARRARFEQEDPHMEGLPTVNPIREIQVAELDGEPRVRDLDLAKRLGFERPRKIRELIERHREALERFGPIHHGVATTHSGTRPTAGRVCWLNEKQSAFVTSKSDTPIATDALVEIVHVFVAWRHGHQPDVGPSLPSGTMEEISRTYGIARQVNGKVTTLERQVELILARRSAVADHKPALRVLEEAGVPPKGRRALSQRISALLKRKSLAMNYQPRFGIETGRPHYHVDVIARWRSEGGNILIAQHMAALRGQGVLQFRLRGV